MDVVLLNVDDLISQTFSDSLSSFEWVLSGSLGDQVDGLVDSSQRRYVNGLLSDNTTSSDSSWIFSRTSQQQSIDNYLQRISASEQMDDLECVSDNSDGFSLFTSVSAVELEWAYKTFDNGAKCFSELLSLISASRVWYEDLGFDWLGSDVVDEAGIFNLCGRKSTLMSSYDHLENSFGAFSKAILEECS